MLFTSLMPLTGLFVHSPTVHRRTRHYILRRPHLVACCSVYLWRTALHPCGRRSVSAGSKVSTVPIIRHMLLNEISNFVNLF